MALIQCPECAREVSDRAVSCPPGGLPVAKEVCTIFAADMEVGPFLPKVVFCIDLSYGYFIFIGIRDIIFLLLLLETFLWIN